MITNDKSLIVEYSDVNPATKTWRETQRTSKK